MKPSSSNDAPETSGAACSNCGAVGIGNFCGACGQKRFRLGDLSVKHALHHLTHELLHFDGKIFHSLKVLLTRPGQLTLDFIEGRRARHVHPVRLFLVFLFAYFLFAPVNPFLDMGGVLTQQLTQNAPAMASMREMAERKGLVADEVLKEASARVRTLSKPLDVGLVFVNGVMLWFLFRKKRIFLAENMVMQLHLASFNMAIQLVIGWLRLLPSLRLIASVAMAGISVTYFLLAGRRVYEGTWGSLTTKYVFILIVQFLLMSSALSLIYLGHIRSTLA